MRIVVTGGPYSGKTSLVRALGDRGYATAPEAAMQVIEKLNREHGVEGQKAWRTKNRVEFQCLIAERQAELERAAEAHSARALFLDRGRHDGVAYCRHFKEEVPRRVAELVAEADYDAVLLLDTLTNFENRSETGRTSDRERSLALRECLDVVYREAGLEPIRIAEAPMTQRTDAALQALGLPLRHP